MEQEVRLVVFKDGDSWVAQCLEYDIGAQASNLDDLQNRFIVAFKAECEESLKRNGAPFEGIPAAPKHFHDMWDHKRTEALGTPQPWELPSHHTGRLALCA